MMTIVQVPKIGEGDKKVSSRFLEVYLKRLNGRKVNNYLAILDLVKIGCDLHYIYERDLEYIFDPDVTYNDVSRLLTQRRRDSI